jgi:hypothetical protein
MLLSDTHEPAMDDELRAVGPAVSPGTVLARSHPGRLDLSEYVDQPVESGALLKDETNGYLNTVRAVE